MTDPTVTGGIGPGARVVVAASGSVTPIIDPRTPITPDLTKAPEVVPWDIFLTIGKRSTDSARIIGKIPTGPLKPTPLPGGPLQQWRGTVKATVRLPSVMPPGRYWLHVCAPVTMDDPNPASNCSTIKTALVPRIQK